MPPGMHTLSRRTSLLGALFVLLLTALFAAANVHWLAANTVTYGWDRLDHLIASFVYRDILRELCHTLGGQIVVKLAKHLLKAF